MPELGARGGEGAERIFLQPLLFLTSGHVVDQALCQPMGLHLPTCVVGSDPEPSSSGTQWVRSRSSMPQGLQEPPPLRQGASLCLRYLSRPCSSGWKCPTSFLGEPMSILGPLRGPLTISIIGRLGIWQEETQRARDGAGTASGRPTGTPPACFTYGGLGRRRPGFGFLSAVFGVFLGRLGPSLSMFPTYVLRSFIHPANMHRVTPLLQALSLSSEITVNDKVFLLCGGRRWERSTGGGISWSKGGDHSVLGGLKSCCPWDSREEPPGSWINGQEVGGSQPEPEGPAWAVVPLPHIPL